jgi:hypothetical protein
MMVVIKMEIMGGLLKIVCSKITQINSDKIIEIEVLAAFK